MKISGLEMKDSISVTIAINWKKYRNKKLEGWSLYIPFTAKVR